MKINIRLWKKNTAATTKKDEADADGREKNEVAESSEPNLAAERVVWTSRKLKILKLKYFIFWSVDSKNAEPRDKVVCKLCKLQLAYHPPLAT